MAINVANDSKLGVTITAPATKDEAGFKAASFTDVPEVVSLPEFTGTRSNVTFNSVTSGQTQFPGNVAHPAVALDVADDPEDAGQAILHAAFDSQATVYLEVAYSNKRTVYVEGKVGKSAISGTFDGVANRQFTIVVAETPLEITSTT